MSVIQIYILLLAISPIPSFLVLRCNCPTKITFGRKTSPWLVVSDRFQGRVILWPQECMAVSIHLAENKETERAAGTGARRNLPSPAPGTYFLQPGSAFKISTPAGDPALILGAWGGDFLFKAEHQPLSGRGTVGRKTSFPCALHPIFLWPESFCQPQATPSVKTPQSHPLCLETLLYLNTPQTLCPTLFPHPVRQRL